MPYKDPQKKKEWIRKNRAKIRKHATDFRKRHGLASDAALIAKRKSAATIVKRKRLIRRLCSLISGVAQSKVYARLPQRGRYTTYQTYFRIRAREIVQNNRYSKEIFNGDDLLKVYERFDWRCFDCGSTTKLCVDHHYPRHGGSILSHANAVILCGSCNASKCSKQPSNYYTQAQLNRLKRVHHVG